MFDVPGSEFRTWNLEPGTLNQNLEHERGTWNQELGTTESNDEAIASILAMAGGHHPRGR